MIEYYDKPIIKESAELKKGDIIECEYGDFDNIVRIVIDEVEIFPEEYYNHKIIGHYANSNQSVEAYGGNKNTVVGREIEE